jgi:5-oxoprolinase (ATP-hydrolysing) subunit C
LILEVSRVYGVVNRIGAPTNRRRFGVPEGGAFDSESQALANALVGRGRYEEVFELGLANVEFKANSAGIASVVGAEAPIMVSGKSQAYQSVFPIDVGDVISLGVPTQGAHVYVSSAPCLPKPGRRLERCLNSLDNEKIRIVKGPQADLFSWRNLLDPPFEVSPAVSRTGIRLNGSIGEHETELPSEPACFGCVQVTRSGDLIIVGPDGPTLGGYPKIAVVITADLPKLGQLRPGQAIRFEEVELPTAHRLALSGSQALDGLLSKLRLTSRLHQTS